MRPPRLIAVANATSSINAPRTAATPPIRTNARRRSSIVPPAAAAVARSGSFTHMNGYSNWKKYTKAGTNARSAGRLAGQCHHLGNQVQIASLGLRHQSR